MVSVALDIFRLPLVLSRGKSFDSVAVCIDRHSSWIVAVPCLNKGLTGAFVAQKMLKWQWRPFGVPSVIKSDQASFPLLVRGLKTCVQVWEFGRRFPKHNIIRRMVGQNALVSH